MRLLTPTQISNIRLSKGYTHKHYGIVSMLTSFVNHLINDDQHQIFEQLGVYYKNSKKAIQNPDDGTVTFEEIPNNFLKGVNAKPEYCVENAIFILMTILLKEYDYTVGLTLNDDGSESGDYGADIVIVPNNSKEPVLMIDTKKGCNSSNNHVIWHFEGEPWLLRAVRDPQEIRKALGEKKRCRIAETHVADITFKHLFENLASVLTEGMSNAEIDEYLISLHKEFAQFAK